MLTRYYGGERRAWAVARFPRPNRKMTGACTASSNENLAELQIAP